MNYNEQGRDDTIQTQVDLEDVTGTIEPDTGDFPTPEELSQENVIINPDPDSMESRG